MKAPVRWKDVADTAGVVTIQKVVRGYLIRRRLKWAGPGVLSRKVCINDEEMVTFDDKNSVHPFDYFGWNDSGKVWWMSVLSVSQLFRGELRPVNPYTKTPFSMEDRKRFRKLQMYCLRRKLPLAHTQPTTPDDQLSIYKFTIHQIMEENGIDGIHPEEWQSLSNFQLFAFLELFGRTFAGWALEPPFRSWRKALADHIRNMYVSSCRSPRILRWAVMRTLTACLLQGRKVYEVAFMIESAKHQTF